MFVPYKCHTADRMLVKVSRSPSGDLPIPFDEDEARRHPDLRGQEWREYLVRWSGRNVELYENYVRYAQLHSLIIPNLNREV